LHLFGRKDTTLNQNSDKLTEKGEKFRKKEEQKKNFSFISFLK